MRCHSETHLFLWSHAFTHHTKILLVGVKGVPRGGQFPSAAWWQALTGKKTLYLWEVSKLTPNRARWLYSAKHTNDACFKGAAQKIFRVYTHQRNNKNVRVNSTFQKQEHWYSGRANSHFSKQIYKFQINRNVTSNLFVISINFSSFINWLLMWFIIST